MCNFKNIRDAADVAIATMHSGIQVSRVELLDEVMMKAINLANDKTFPEEITLMFEFIGTGANFLHFACFFPFCSFVHFNSLCIRMLAVQSNQGIGR
jgi:hypothetical protein